MQKSEHGQSPKRLNITLIGDSAAEMSKLRRSLEAELGVRLSIAEVVRLLVAKANHNQN